MPKRRDHSREGQRLQEGEGVQDNVESSSTPQRSGLGVASGGGAMHSALSRRDIFALWAVREMLRQFLKDGGFYDSPLDTDKVFAGLSEMAYRFADAMIKASEGR